MDIAGITLKNPVMPASGTFGSGQEYSGFVDLNRLGAVVTKGVSCVPWEGNPSPRIMETASGMINAVGLQEPGMVEYITKEIKKKAAQPVSMKLTPNVTDITEIAKAA